MSPRGAAGVLAGLVILVGVILGYVPHHLAADPVLGVINCGSAFSPSVDAAGTDLGSAAAGVPTNFTQQCSDALSAPRTISFVLIGVGVLVGLFCLLTAIGAQPKRESPKPVQETLS